MTSPNGFTTVPYIQGECIDWLQSLTANDDIPPRITEIEKKNIMPNDLIIEFVDAQQLEDGFTQATIAFRYYGKDKHVVYDDINKAVRLFNFLTSPSFRKSPNNSTVSILDFSSPQPSQYEGELLCLEGSITFRCFKIRENV